MALGVPSLLLLLSSHAFPCLHCSLSLSPLPAFLLWHGSMHTLPCLDLVLPYLVCCFAFFSHCHCPSLLSLLMHGWLSRLACGDREVSNTALSPSCTLAFLETLSLALALMSLLWFGDWILVLAMLGWELTQTSLLFLHTHSPLLFAQNFCTNNLSTSPLHTHYPSLLPV